MNLTDPSTLCLFLLAVIVVVLMFRTRVRVAAQNQQSDKGDVHSSANSGTSKETLTSQQEASSAERDLARWEVQMHETARELSAHLDAKLSLLQSLTAEADRAAQRLEVLPDRTPSQSPVADSQREGLADIKVGGMEPDLAADEPQPTEITSPSDRSRRREEIYQLADYGFAPAEIARRVGSPVGEVELILSLRQS